jgi:hypothetical protein
MSSLETSCPEPGLSPAAGAEPAPKRLEASLYPRFICRVAGLPVGVLEEMRAQETAAGLAGVAELERRLAASKDELTAALYEAVGGLEDRRLRRRLLAIRRDVHNGRPLDAEALDAAAAVLPPTLHRDLEGFRALDQERRERLARLAEVYETELAASRRRLQEAAADPDFANGLLLSSRPLHAGLARYRKAKVGRLGAKERQLERGLLRYLSRMAVKTTPFATFTSIVPGRFTDGGEPGAPAFSGDPRVKRSVVRLNKRIYAVLREELLADDEVRPHLPVELNPTLRLEGDRWRFLAAAADNHEIFRRIPRNPVLDLFAELLAGGPVALGELERRLAARPEVEASPEEVAAYVRRLLEIGLLKFRLGIGEQEADWDGPLAELLRSASGAGADNVRRLLAHLREGRDAFERAPVERRAELLDESKAVMRETCARLLDRVRLPTDIPFYEDCAGEAALEIPGTEVAAAASDLAAWVRLTARLAWPRSEKATMRHFFDGYYADERSVPLLRFYEDYYREHFKEQLERQRRLERGLPPAAAEPEHDEEGDGEERGHGGGDAAVDVHNPFGLEVVTAMDDASRAFERLLAERWRDRPRAEEIELTVVELEELLGAVPEPRHPCISSTAFVQPLPGCGRGGGTALFCCGLLRGFGKYFSRFLHVLPDELRADLAAHHDRLTGELLAEISADGAFNANLHPPVLRWEIGYPTSDCGYDQGQILVSDLVVEAHPGDPHALALRHVPSGKPVVALDLGFQNPSMRPPLYQLLSTFAPASNFMPRIPQTPAAEAAAAEHAPAGPPGASASPPDRVGYRPRVRFGDALILSRRRWSVPHALYPRRLANETDWEHFLRVQHWRRERGIPREVFLSIYPPAPVRAPAPPAEAAAPATAEEREKAEGEAPPPAAAEAEPPAEAAAETPASRTPTPPRRGHTYKPQYIDFDNPLLIDLFGRALENLDGFDAYLYERLPAREHLPAAGDDRYATELVLQVDVRTEGPGTPGDAEVDDAR